MCQFLPKGHAWEAFQERGASPAPVKAKQPGYAPSRPPSCQCQSLPVWLGAWAQSLEQGAVTSASPPSTSPIRARPGKGCTKQGSPTPLPPPQHGQAGGWGSPQLPGQPHLHPRTADPFPGSDSGHLSQRDADCGGCRAGTPPVSWPQAGLAELPRGIELPPALSCAKDPKTRAVGARGHPIPLHPPLGDHPPPGAI